MFNVFWTTLCSCTGAFALVAARHCTLTTRAQELEAEPSASFHSPRTRAGLKELALFKQQHEEEQAPRDCPAGRSSAQRHQAEKSPQLPGLLRRAGTRLGQAGWARCGELNKPSRFLRDKPSQQAVTKLTMTREQRAGWASEPESQGLRRHFLRTSPLR